MRLMTEKERVEYHLKLALGWIEEIEHTHEELNIGLRHEWMVRRNIELALEFLKEKV